MKMAWSYIFDIFNQMCWPLLLLLVFPSPATEILNENPDRVWRPNPLTCSNHLAIMTSKQLLVRETDNLIGYTGTSLLLILESVQDWKAFHKI